MRIDVDLSNGGISIHAPRKGSDMYCLYKSCPRCIFQSTPPARGATQQLKEGMSWEQISIHAPRKGSD